MLPISIDEYETYKWEILGDAVDEDWQGLWEPLWWAKTKFPNRSAQEREAVAERAMLELLTDGLVYFVSMGPWPGGIPKSKGATPKPTALTTEEATAAITGASWRTCPLPDASIWFGGTEAGEHAVRRRWPNAQG